MTTLAMRTLEVNEDERRLLLEALILLDDAVLDAVALTIPGTIKEQRLKSDRTWIAALKRKVR